MYLFRVNIFRISYSTVNLGRIKPFKSKQASRNSVNFLIKHLKENIFSVLIYYYMGKEPMCRYKLQITKTVRCFIIL